MASEPAMGVRELRRGSKAGSVGVRGPESDRTRSGAEEELLSNILKASPNRPLTMFLVPLVSECKLDLLLCFV